MSSHSLLTSLSLSVTSYDARGVSFDPVNVLYINYHHDVCAGIPDLRCVSKLIVISKMFFSSMYKIKQNPDILQKNTVFVLSGLFY